MRSREGPPGRLAPKPTARVLRLPAPVRRTGKVVTAATERLRLCAQIHDIGGLGAQMAAASQVAVLPPGDVCIGDLPDLLSAIAARLQKLVPAATPPRPPYQIAWPLAATLDHAATLECAQAVQQLQASLVHELLRRQQLEAALTESRAALAQLRAELAGTRAGERLARRQALYDGLTALPNRHCFHERLAAALGPAHRQRQRPALAVIYLDLDGFKSVNDTHGHAVGDELLRIVAARLTNAVRAGDIVGRLGGDEFACVLSERLTRTQLSQVAQQLFNAVALPFTIGALRCTVMPSMGIAMCPDHGTTTQTLVSCADAAMYRAKRERSRYAFYDAALDTPSETGFDNTAFGPEFDTGFDAAFDVAMPAA